MIGHLGSRVSALLDGQLSPEETERAWAHVHACHACRDQVEHEGWVKTRLAGLSFGETPTPDHLKGSLLGPRSSALAAPQFPRYDGRVRRNVGLVAMGGGAVGAAFVGILALGAAPAEAPPAQTPPSTLLSPNAAPSSFGQATPPRNHLRQNATP